MNPFAIAPHEFAGTSFEAAPHAVVRHEIGGETRDLQLKMRDGVIYFREAKRAPMFAVLRRFDAVLANDADALIEAWKREVRAGNYGAYFITHRGWKGTLAAGNFRVILREDGRGWVAEHFDESWTEFAIEASKAAKLWQPKPTFGAQGEQIFRQIKAQFLQRAVAPHHFASVPAHWVGGNGEAMASVMRSAATLFFQPDDFAAYDNRPIEWRARSNSGFLAGAVSDGLIYSACYRVITVWNLARWHFGYVGIEWQKASENPDLQAQYKPAIWQRNWDKWGENWRGNWVGRQSRVTITTPPISPPSTHEKLEAALILREFLRDKMPAQKLDKLLDGALAK